MDFTCGAYEPRPTHAHHAEASFRSQSAPCFLELLDSSQKNSVVYEGDDDDGDDSDDNELDSDFWTISSLPGPTFVSAKEDDDSDLTNVTSLSSFSEDYLIESATLSDVSSLISWADEYLLQFEGYDLDNFYSSSGEAIDLKEISQLIIDGILREILCQ